MPGTLFGLGLSQQFDGDGDPLSGAKLYIYEAGTTNPADVFQDYNLSLDQTWPVIADANGRIPMFWLDDGSYRARLTDSAGVVQFDYDNIQALGPSSGSASGGTIDSTTIFATGDFIWNAGYGVRPGWVRANGRSIGSASSGASERANADTEALFSYLWNAFGDSICPVATGRGVSAAADFAANKAISLLDMRGRIPVGLDDMANTAAARLDSSVVSSGLVTTPGNSGGASTVALTSGQMPSHTHVATATAVADHQHYMFDNTAFSTADLGSVPNTPPVTNYGSGAGETSYLMRSRSGTASAGLTSAAGGHTPSVTNANTGGGAAHTNMPPFVLGTFWIKL